MTPRRPHLPVSQFARLAHGGGGAVHLRNRQFAPRILPYGEWNRRDLNQTFVPRLPGISCNSWCRTADRVLHRDFLSFHASPSIDPFKLREERRFGKLAVDAADGIFRITNRDGFAQRRSNIAPAPIRANGRTPAPSGHSHATSRLPRTLLRLGTTHHVNCATISCY